MTMFGMGPMELILIGVIILLIFGGKKIPEIGKGLGGALREFRNVKKEISGTKPKKDDISDQGRTNGEDKSPSIEAELSKKLLEQVPGVKKVMDIKEKVKKVEDVIDKI
jgi:sec-independent protein translocase protein TatA